jgi:mannose-6-phosphate isomerase-like protein (cupin superfamily)
MPRGRTINNPISGERIVILESGDDNDGRLLRFDLYLPPRGHVPAGHVHPKQEERFTVVSGGMLFRMGAHRIHAKPGDTVIIPAGKAHWFGNPGSKVSQARVEVRPALRMEELFEATEALSTAPHAGAQLAIVAALAQVLLDFKDELAVPHVPAPLATAILAIVAKFGRRDMASTA